MAGEVINIGTSANDGTGDPLRTALSKINTRFARVINVTDYGAVGDGVADDGPAIQLAITAAASGGKRVYFPAGTYLLTTAVALNTDIHLQGAGNGSILKFGYQKLTATSKNNITIEDMQFASLSTTPFQTLFTLCNNINIRRCLCDGDPSGVTTLGGILLRFAGCVGITIEDCVLYDFNDGIYLEKSGATNSDRALVKNCHFEHRSHSTGDSYPVGVYQYYCDNLAVDGCTFKNIFAGSAVGDRIGYAVYEGDGSCTSLRVTNCQDILTESTIEAHSFVQTSSCDYVTVANNRTYDSRASASHNFCNLSGASAQMVVEGNISYNGIMMLGAASNVGAAVVKGNVVSGVVQVANTGAIRIGANGFGVDRVIISGNQIASCASGGIALNYCAKHFTVTDNIVIDCNTADTAYSAGSNELQVSGIGIYGPLYGIVARNHVENTRGGSGHMDLGISEVYSGGVQNIDVRENRVLRMDTSPYKNGFDASNRPVNVLSGIGTEYRYATPTAYGPKAEVITDQRKTTVSGTEAAGQTVITVASVTGMAVNDKIGIWLDSGALHLSKITAISGSDVTINDALPSQAGNGNEVMTARYEKDVETGTFTPALTCVTVGNLSVAYTTQQGRYTRIGNRVFYDLCIITSSFTHTTASGDIRITGLPYLASSTANYFPPAAMLFDGVTKAGYTQFAAYANPSESYLKLYAMGTGVASAIMAITDLPTGSNKSFHVSGSYQVG